jgi:hypothetical protein
MKTLIGMQCKALKCHGYHYEIIKTMHHGSDYSWDEQIAKDSQPGGRLEGILSKVRRDIEAKQTLPLDEFLDNA